MGVRATFQPIAVRAVGDSGLRTFRTLRSRVTRLRAFGLQVKARGFLVTSRLGSFGARGFDFGPFGLA